MIDLNIFENELWRTLGYYIVTILTWIYSYIVHGKPFLVWKTLMAAKKPLRLIENLKAAEKPLKLLENLKVCRKTLRSSQEPQKNLIS